jgi:hypothetical protein
MALHHNPRITTSGLMFALDAADTNSYPGTGTVWKDLSGNGKNISVYSGAPTFNTDGIGNFDFDGTSDRFLLSNTGWEFPNWTIITVVRPQSNTGNYRAWFSASSTSGYDYATGVNWDMSGNASSTYQIQNIEISRNYGGFYDRDIMTSNFAFGTWVWQALTCSADANQVQMFINGVREYNKTDYAGTTTFFDNIAISDRYYSISSAFRGYPLDGNVALTLLYNRALTTSELEQNFEAQRSRFGL